MSNLLRDGHLGRNIKVASVPLVQLGVERSGMDRIGDDGALDDGDRFVHAGTHVGHDVLVTYVH